MTKLLMMIVLACTVQAAAVFAQEPEVNTLQPRYLEDKDYFAANYVSERVTTLYAPRLVCTKADAPRPGARGVGGPCNENFRMAIPLDNSPAWDCEKAHGVGNCLLIQVPRTGKVAFRPNGALYQREEPYYVPKCKKDFQLYFVVVEKDSIDAHRWWLYCTQPKQIDQ